MPVSFNQFPADWKLPLFWVEVDPSKAGFPVLRQPALLVGQFFSTASGVANIPVAVSSEAQAISLFGEGSMLHRMVVAFLNNNRAHELWCLPMSEPNAGVKATGTIVVSSAPTAAGTLFLYISGQLVRVGIADDDTQAEVATKIAAAITAIHSLPVDVAVNSSDLTMVNVTAKWKGTTGNGIDIRLNYRGTAGSEATPAGLALTLSGSGKLTGGTDEPDFATAISNLGEEGYEYVALPFTDSTTLLDWTTEYGFDDSGRWGWMRQLYGHIFSARSDTYGNQLTFGASVNSGVLSVMDVEPGSPTPVWEWAAAYTAKAARALLNDPARPLQTLPLVGILPAPPHQRRLLTERNVLAGHGLATQATNAGDVVVIQRETTTYQFNSYNVGDDAYTDVTTLATLARLFRNLKQAVTSNFPRHKLANDGTRFGAGQAIVTPKTVKAFLVAQYRIDEFNGLVEDAVNFKKNLIVERDSDNPNRLNVLFPPDIINQLRIFAVLAQFRLQFDRGVDLAIA